MAAIVLAVAAPAARAGAQPPAAGAASPPNIVIVLVDDLGWNDVGYHGSEIRTPHIDRIAREGVELDRFYVQPTCSPTRAALMTGKSPLALGITLPLGKNDEGGLGLEETILPQYLARAGYQPLMVGKWHLGNHTPDYFPHERGFEHFYGYLCGGIGYWDHNHGGGHDWQRNGETLREEGYATRLLADEAVRALRTRDRSRPTFLYLAFGAPHLPNEAPEPTVAAFGEIEDESRRVHAAMVSELDTAIGRVLAALEQEGMADDTLLLFSSDNGGLTADGAPPQFVTAAKLALRLFDRPIPIPALEFMVANVLDAGSSNAPLRKGKTSVAEGGVRVPAALWWPGHLEAARHEGFTTVSDVLPTLLDAIGRPDLVPSGLHGASRWVALQGGDSGTTPDYAVAGFEGRAIFRPPWKLVAVGTPQLYDVYADPLEQHDRAADRPALTASLAAALDAWPTLERPEATTPFGLLWDPDSFGGPEDREPWADAAKRRGRAAD